MPIACITISECVQDIQDISENKNESVMRSRINFSMKIDEQEYKSLYVVVSQPYGTNYATEPLEVGPPVGYDGPFSHRAFSEEVEAYYRKLVGPTGSAISIGGGGGIRMRGNRFGRQHSFSFDVDNGRHTGW